MVRGFFSGNDRWGLPGGGLHRGEQPAAGAARELFEETGIHLPPTRLTLLGEAIFRQYGLKFHYYQLAVELKQRPTVRAQKSEVAAVSWQPIVGIKSNDVNDDVVSTLAVWHDGRS